MSLAKQGCQYFSRWRRCAVVWDDIGTCRAMDKHGASTVVSGGDGIRKREHVTTTNSILNGMQRILTVSLLNDGLILVGNYEYFSKITINAKEPPRGSHSTATRVFVHQSGRQNRKSRVPKARAGNFDVFIHFSADSWEISCQKRRKTQVSCEIYLQRNCGSVFLKKYFITKSGFRIFKKKYFITKSGFCIFLKNIL